MTMATVHPDWSAFNEIATSLSLVIAPEGWKMPAGQITAYAQALPKLFH